jgi:glycosyltransferase involved in cell wall biosynthesis
MRILIAHNYYQQSGGEDQCVAQEIALLREHGHDVGLFSLHNDGIKTMGKTKAAHAAIWNSVAHSQLRETLREKPADIVHFHNTFPLMSPAAYYAARAEGVRVVQTLHNYRLACANALLLRDGRVCEDCLGHFAPWKSMRCGCYRGSRAASTVTTAMLATHRAMGTWRNAVDVYIALTEFGRRKFIAAGLPPERIVVKPNFVSPDRGVEDGGGNFAIFVGRLSEEKGVTTLLQTWQLLRGAMPLVIVGDGPLAPLVREAAERDPTIRWLGRLCPDAVLQLIGDAEFVVLPSICFEAFPRVIAEAFSKGTPVIASRAGAMAELVDDGRTGLLFTAGDPADLARIVRRQQSDRPAFARMRAAARAEFESHFTAELNYASLMQIYARVLAGAPSAKAR